MDSYEWSLAELAGPADGTPSTGAGGSAGRPRAEAPLALHAAASPSKTENALHGTAGLGDPAAAAIVSTSLVPAVLAGRYEDALAAALDVLLPSAAPPAPTSLSNVQGKEGSTADAADRDEAPALTDATCSHVRVRAATHHVR